MVAGTEIHSSEWRFIESEPLGLQVEVGEQRIWERSRQIFPQGEGVPFWSYRTFFKDEQIIK